MTGKYRHFLDVLLKLSHVVYGEMMIYLFSPEYIYGDVSM